jgi:molybdopterin converting factor small subunit
MAMLRLRAPLSELTGSARHDLAGDTVLEVLAALESTYPSVAGWILDEQRRVRVHVNVYVNGQPAREDDRVGATDQVFVLPSITGGET